MVSRRIDVEEHFREERAKPCRSQQSPADRTHYLAVEPLHGGKGNASPPNRTVNCRRAHE